MITGDITSQTALSGYVLDRGILSSHFSSDWIPVLHNPVLLTNLNTNLCKIGMNVNNPVDSVIRTICWERKCAE